MKEIGTEFGALTTSSDDTMTTTMYIIKSDYLALTPLTMCMHVSLVSART